MSIGKGCDCLSHLPENMVYSQARLEHALYVFRNASSYIRARGLHAKNLRSHLGRNANFRRAPIDHTSKEFRTWQPVYRQDCEIDSDDEYHPDKTKKTKRKTHGLERKPKTLKRKSDNSEDGAQETKTKKIRRERVEDITKETTCYTTLKLSSVHGRLFLQQLADIATRESSPDGPSLFRLTGGSFDDAKPPQLPEWMQLERELVLEGLDLEDGTLRSGKKRDKASVSKCKKRQEQTELTEGGNTSWTSHATSSPVTSNSHDDRAPGDSSKSATVESNVIIIDDTDDEFGPKPTDIPKRCALDHSVRHASVRKHRTRLSDRPKFPPSECEVIVIGDTEDEEDSVTVVKANSISVRAWTLHANGSDKHKFQANKSNVIVIDDSD